MRLFWRSKGKRSQPAESDAARDDAARGESVRHEALRTEPLRTEPLRSGVSGKHGLGRRELGLAVTAIPSIVVRPGMTVAEAEAARHPLLPGATEPDDSVDEGLFADLSSAGPATAGELAAREAAPRDQHGLPADASVSATGSQATGAQAAWTSAAGTSVPVLPSFLPAAQDILPGAPPPLTPPPLTQPPLTPPAPAAPRPPLSASPAATSPPATSPLEPLPVPQDSLELLDWFDAHPVAEAPPAPAEHAPAEPDVSRPGLGESVPAPVPGGVAAFIPVQPVPDSVTRTVVPSTPPFVPPSPLVVPPPSSVVSSSTQPSAAQTPPEVASVEQASMSTVAQPQFMPGPRVELGFRDGSHTQLDPAGEQAQALEELARTLTGF